MEKILSVAITQVNTFYFPLQRYLNSTELLIPG